MRRPEAHECHAYYRGYIDLVPDGDIVALLDGQLAVTEAMLARMPGDLEERRPSPERWNAREVVGHLVDAERVFTHRALWIARGARGELASMEQEEWVARSNAATRPLADHLEEWRAVRRATVLLFRSFDATAWGRSGIASGWPIHVSALPWIVAGHELHHRRILERDYLGGGR